jgi:mono/diheme cytochrome c family protein
VTAGVLGLPNKVFSNPEHSLCNGGIIAVVPTQQPVVFRHVRPAARVLAAGGLCIAFGLPLVSADDDAPYVAQDMTRVDARTLAGWRAVRQFDCARCHGAQYQGSVGPSLVEAARANTREQFVRLLLDGNRERGMPPYRDVRGVADNAEGIYGYFRGRADGNIGPGGLQPLR